MLCDSAYEAILTLLDCFGHGPLPRLRKVWIINKGESDVAVSAGRYRVEIGRHGLKIGVLGEVALALPKLAFDLALQLYLCWANSVALVEEIVLVGRFWLNRLTYSTDG